MTGQLYFIGIAGHTMRGLALAARDIGYQVTGLDEPAAPPGSDWLDEHNFVWHRHFDSIQLEGVTTVIVTGAHVTKDSLVIVEARRRGIPVQSYAEFFGQLTLGEQVIAVAGTHGKTTTTALIAWILESAGRRPDFLIGIQPFNFPASVRYAGADVAVVEADEYKASTLDTKSKAQYYHPDILVLTAVEHDHPDFFTNLAAVERRFKTIVAALPKHGHLIACAEADNVLKIAEQAPCRSTSYGIEAGDIRARNITYLPEGIEFEAERDGEVLGHLAVNLYGRHNVLNTLGAIAAAIEHGLSFNDILTGAATFKGAYRRFTIVSAPQAEITVIDDYAHHPTEVATNLEAAKLHFKGHRVVVIFRPHTYSRTAALLSEYQAAFDNADLVFITDIEGARETGNVATVSGQDIVDKLTMPAQYEPDRAQLINHVASQVKPGDVILCLSVSGHLSMAQELAAALKDLPQT
jgi:UDP-N-acetylmuramate--alanine ligase